MTARTYTRTSNRANPRWRAYEPARQYEFRLARVMHQGDGYYARWEQWDTTENWHMSTLCALHTADGRLDVAGDLVPTGADLTLTADEMANADDPQTPEHPAYGLARRGYRRDDAHRSKYLKAADIVAAGGVELTHFRTGAVTSTSGERYTVWDRTCTCDYKKYNPGREHVCSHILAVRMAQALLTDEERAAQEARTQTARERSQRNREAARVRVANRGQNKITQWDKQKYRDGDGARAYIRQAVGNGATTIRPDIYERATGGAS